MKYSIRSVLVIALVGLQLVAVATILLSSYLTSERALLGHARDLMLDVADETIEHSVNFLEPAQDAADLSQRLAQQQVVNSENPETLERYFFEQLQSYPQFSGVYYGNAAGAFVYVKRDAGVVGAQYRTKVISVDDAGRRVDITWRDESFAVIGQAPDPSDAYDPRQRPWYQLAVERRGVAWTEPYIFFTSRNPGITVAAPVLAGPSEIKGVVGVDIEIGEISEFVGTLEIGKSGIAFIINRNGDVVAHPDPTRIKTLKADGSDGLRFTRIDELSDPIGRSAFESLGMEADGFRVAEPVFSSFERDGATYLAAFSPMPQGQWPWTVGIYVPEDDFLGAIKDNRRDNIFIALLIAVLTAAIGLVMAGSISRPIAVLHRQAKRIARGEFTGIETLPSTYEELSRAGIAFNRMAAWLDSYKADNENLNSKLRQISRELEVRVEERTGALSDANKNLRGEIEERKAAEIKLAEEAQQHLRTAEALREARDRADTANAAKSRFLSNMSHELRTPLNVIAGFTQILKRKDEIKVERPERYLDHILESSDRLLGLIDQVLDLAKIEAGKMLLSIESVESREVLSTVKAQAEILATQKRITLIDETDPSDAPKVAADPGRLEQALMNLLSNAIKYNRPGGKVILSGRSRGASYRFAVTDTGMGIPADRQGELFEPFNRLGAEKSAIEGTGVGLALTKEIVEKMGGQLSYESSEERGSSFWIDLPIAQAVADSQPAKDPGDVDQLPRFARPMRVLYVEDHEPSCELVAETFRICSDMAIEIAKSPEEGIDKARAAPPDLILLDINLPGMDGFAFLERLRGEAGCADIPVIAVTADAMPDQVLRGRAAGLADYLTKPLDLEKLRAAVFRTLLAA